MKKHAKNIAIVALVLIVVSILIYVLEQALGIELIQRRAEVQSLPLSQVGGLVKTAFLF